MPKNVYIAPRRTVKKINTSRHIRGGADAEDGAFGTFAEPGAEDATTGTWDRNE